MENSKPFDIEQGGASIAQEPNQDNGGRKREKLSMLAEQTLIEKVVAVLAVIAVATSIAALVVVGGMVVKTAAILSCLLSPYSYYQQTRITDVRALKETFNALEGEVDELEEQNNRLNSSVQDLGQAVDKLEHIDTVLKALNETQGGSVESLKETVEMNRKTVETMEKNVRAAVLQNIISVVFSSDKNEDQNLSDEETTALIKSLEGINGVEVDDKKFLKIVKENNGSIDAVVSILKNLLCGNADMANSVFTFES